MLLVVNEREEPSEITTYVPGIALRLRSDLQAGGFTVDIASATGRLRIGDREMNPIPNHDLRSVATESYAGVVFACRSVAHPWQVLEQELAVAQEMVAGGKFAAANGEAIELLAHAGVLVGKRYSYAYDPLNARFDWQIDTRFEGGIYGGREVISAGDVVTDQYCGPGTFRDRVGWLESDHARLNEFVVAVTSALQAR